MGPVFKGPDSFFSFTEIRFQISVNVHNNIQEENKNGIKQKSVDDINVKGLRVLCRCDFNVPLKRWKDHRREPFSSSTSMIKN